MKTYFSDDKESSVIFTANGVFVKSEKLKLLTLVRYSTLEEITYETDEIGTYIAVLSTGEKEYYEMIYIQYFRNHSEIYLELQNRFLEYQNKDVAVTISEIKDVLIALAYAPGGPICEAAKIHFEENI